jgi:hypothetical protein
MAVGPSPQAPPRSVSLHRLRLRSLLLLEDLFSFRPIDPTPWAIALPLQARMREQLRFLLKAAFFG